MGKFIRTSFCFALLIVLVAGAVARAEEHKDDGLSLHFPDKIKWQEAPATLPKGAFIAILEGDPAKEGPFVLRFKFPDGYKVMPHWHPIMERVTIIQGVLHIGMGETFDDDATKPMPVGTFGTWDAHMRHFAYVKGETILQLHGIGPWTITYVDPKDDPRNAKP